MKVFISIEGLESIQAYPSPTKSTIGFGNPIKICKLCHEEENEFDTHSLVTESGEVVIVCDSCFDGGVRNGSIFNNDFVWCIGGKNDN